MKSLKTIFFRSIIIILLASTNSYSELLDRGAGLIYDTDLNITWLQDANYSMTSGYNADGKMTWNDAITWAENLTYQGYNDWRLPSALKQNGSNPCVQYCSDSEMGHLFYTEFKNFSGGPLTNIGPFLNLQPDIYWSNTGKDNSTVWVFNFDIGFQGTETKTHNHIYSLAVRSGDSAPIAPEPLSSILFVAGGIILAGKKISNRIFFLN